MTPNLKNALGYRCSSWLLYLSFSHVLLFMVFELPALALSLCLPCSKVKPNSQLFAPKPLMIPRF